MDIAVFQAQNEEDYTNKTFLHKDQDVSSQTIVRPDIYYRLFEVRLPCLRVFWYCSRIYAYMTWASTAGHLRDNHDKVLRTNSQHQTKLKPCWNRWLHALIDYGGLTGFPVILGVSGVKWTSVSVDSYLYLFLLTLMEIPKFLCRLWNNDRNLANPEYILWCDLPMDLPQNKH